MLFTTYWIKSYQKVHSIEQVSKACTLFSNLGFKIASAWKFLIASQLLDLKLFTKS